MNSTVDKEKLGDLIVELALNEPHDKFPVSEVDAFVAKVQARMPEVTVEEIEESGWAGGFFPSLDEIYQYRKIQQEGAVVSDNKDKVDDHSGPHQLALQFIAKMVSGIKELPIVRREEIWRRAQRIDPALTHSEFDLIAQKAMNTAEQPNVTPAKPRTNGQEGPRCFFRTSATYRSNMEGKPDYDRQKIVVRYLTFAYQLPADLHTRERTLEEIRTALSKVYIDVSNAVIEQDVLCWRVAFLYYCATPRVREFVNGMINANHPATIPLQYLLKDDLKTWESLGLESQSLFGKEEEEAALEALTTLSQTQEKNVKKNLFQNSPNYVENTSDDMQKRYAFLLPVVLREFEGKPKTPRAELLQQLEEAGVPNCGNFSNEIKAINIVLEYYRIGPGHEEAVKLLKSKDNRAGLLRRLLTDFESWDDLVAGKLRSTPPEVSPNGRRPRKAAEKPGKDGGEVEVAEISAAPNVPTLKRLDTSQFEIPKGVTGKSLRVIMTMIGEVNARIEEYQEKIRKEEQKISELEADFVTLHRATLLAGKYSE